MSVLTLASALTLFSAPAFAQYYLVKDYVSDGNFFDQWSFWDTTQQADPTQGFVQYVPRDTAQNDGLISASTSNVYIGVDSTNVQPNGRPAVRLTSNDVYSSGLFILDLANMPGGICGTWPAFWTVGTGTWPSNGEIDIIEGVHQSSVNAMTMHTENGCNLANTGAFTGNEISSNCYIDAPGQSNNEGCSTQASGANSYGTGFNAQGGGVYAMEWVSDAISIWYWPPNAVPSDIGEGQPTPANWGAPNSQLYQSGCNIDQFFANQQIVINTDFCGQWAGQQSVWQNSGCAQYADTCNDYVANNPSAFQNAYWSINSLKVYQISGQNDQENFRQFSTKKTSNNWREFTAKTPGNYTQAQLHTLATQHHVQADMSNPSNRLLPPSPHGPADAKA